MSGRLFPSSAIDLKENEMVDFDWEPWGAIIVLLTKPEQEDVPWYDFIWKFSMSYQVLNRIM